MAVSCGIVFVVVSDFKRPQWGGAKIGALPPSVGAIVPIAPVDTAAMAAAATDVRTEGNLREWCGHSACVTHRDNAAAKTLARRNSSAVHTRTAKRLRYFRAGNC